MNTENFFGLMAHFANKHGEAPMPEYEIQAYEAMCRSTAALCLMQEAMFRKEALKINAELDGDSSESPRKAA